MQRTVFYSWQSDLPNTCNRSFIQTALENIATNITADESIDIEPVIDRDTQGVAGSPDIASTIFAKITAADIFVADVSIINRSRIGRRTPNPNVLLELGYALKTLGQERVILVFNEAFGRPQDLPFDLRMRRLVVYNSPRIAEDRSTERNELRQKLDQALRSAVKHIPVIHEETESIPAVLAIEEQRANRIGILRKNLDSIFTQLEKLEPKKHRDGGTVEELLSGIAQTQEVVAEFSKISSAIALMADTDSAIEVMSSFGRIFEQYENPQGYSGRYSTADFDYMKFLGHELLVTHIAYLLREHRWDILKQALLQSIPMSYIQNRGSGVVYWDFASEHLELLIQESRNKNRISVQADILHERHTTRDLATIMPFNDFAAADFFLYLCGEFEGDNTSEPQFKWRPWSFVFLENAPLFLHEAENKQKATKLLEIFDIADTNLDTFKTQLTQKISFLGRLFGSFLRIPIREEVINNIGTRG